MTFNRNLSTGFFNKVNQWVKLPFVIIIRFYQMAISPWIPSTCRFYPTCSQYALDAYKQYNPLSASVLTFRRIIKCHPFHPGGYDPLPEKRE